MWAWGEWRGCPARGPCALVPMPAPSGWARGSLPEGPDSKASALGCPGELAWRACPTCCYKCPLDTGLAIKGGLWGSKAECRGRPSLKRGLWAELRAGLRSQQACREGGGRGGARGDAIHTAEGRPRGCWGCQRLQRQKPGWTLAVNCRSMLWGREGQATDRVGTAKGRGLDYRPCSETLSWSHVSLQCEGPLAATLMLSLASSAGGKEHLDQRVGGHLFRRPLGVKGGPELHSSRTGLELWS